MLCVSVGEIKLLSKCVELVCAWEGNDLMSDQELVLIKKWSFPLP